MSNKKIWRVIRTEQETPDGLKLCGVSFGYFPDLTPPEDNVKIWRFMDLPKFLSIIQSKTLYFTRADQFDDPFEGARGNTGVESKYEEALAQALKNEYETQGYKTTKSDTDYLEDARMVLSTWGKMELNINHIYQNFISCWHRNEVESDAMWRLYTKDLSQGIAIQTTCGRLRDSFHAANWHWPIIIAPVNYIDYSLPLGPSDNPFWFKRLSFKHEDEIRAVFEFQYKSMEEAPTGCSLPVEPTVLIENLYVSPTAQTWFVELVKDVIGKYGYEFNVIQSKLLDKGFR